MTQVSNFEHNGLTIVANDAPTPIGPLGHNVVGWVVTAPDKDDSIAYNTPFRVANFKDAALLDVSGDERGTGYHAAVETLKKTQVPQYFIVVQEGADEAQTLANIIGGVDPSTGRRKGIASLSECAEIPTIIAAPGFSHQKAVIDELASMAKRLRCRVVADGPSGSTQDAITLSESLGGEGTGHERVYVVDPMPQIYSKKALGNIYVPPSTIAVGALASVKPWESPGNQGVLIQDVVRAIDYGITDKSTEGGLLNSYGISYFGRTSLGGFSLLGNRSVTGKFISFVGLEDAIARKLESACQKGMAKQLTASFLAQEVKKVDLFMQDLVRDEVIPGGRVYLHPELNTVERYKNGAWYVVIEYGQYSPNEHMILHLNASDEITNDYIQGVL